MSVIDTISDPTAQQLLERLVRVEQTGEGNLHEAMQDYFTHIRGLVFAERKRREAAAPCAADTYNNVKRLERQMEMARKHRAAAADGDAPVSRLNMLAALEELCESNHEIGREKYKVRAARRARYERKHDVVVIDGKEFPVVRQHVPKKRIKKS